MRFIDSLCPPALLYLIYTVVHIGLDLSLGRFATAGIKLIMGVSGVVILDALCGVDLGIVSWAIVATPFIMVALASSISLGLGMDHLLHEKFTSGDDPECTDPGASGPCCGPNPPPNCLNLVSYGDKQKRGASDLQSTSALYEKFTTPLSGDNLKKNDSVGQQAFKIDGNPLSTSTFY
jgi:hypothetical protein